MITGMTTNRCTVNVSQETKPWNYENWSIPSNGQLACVERERK